MAFGKRVKLIIFLFLVGLMFFYSITFVIKTHTSNYKASNSMRRANFKYYMDNTHVNHQIDIKSLDYFNLSTFNAYVDEHCPIEKLDVTYTCLKQLSEFEELEKPVLINRKFIYYHTFWHIDDNDDENYDKNLDVRIMKLNLLSFLATQNLLQTKLILWTLKPLNYKLNMHLKKLFDNYLNKEIIQFKIVNLKKLCSKDLFLQLRYEVCTKVDEKNELKRKFYITALSDFLRFLILYNYGGIWVDGDVIFLSDMKPFWFTNFAYRWSFINDYNTAVIGIKDDLDDFMKQVYLRVLLASHENDKFHFLRAFHPFSIRAIISKLNNGNLYNHSSFKIYHSALFDPVWLCEDGLIKENSEINKATCKFSDIYDLKIAKNEFNIKEFYQGAFTYHLHLKKCGSCIIRNNSYFYHLESYFKSALKFQ